MTKRLIAPKQLYYLAIVRSRSHRVTDAVDLMASFE